MNYIYDVLINFNSELYDFFEWNKEDNIIHIRKIPLVKVNLKIIQDILVNKVKFRAEFINTIFNKTEFFDKNKISLIPYALIVANEDTAIALKINNEGYVIKYSNLLIEEEIDALNYVRNCKCENILYDIIKKNKQKFKTREEIIIQNYLKNEIVKIIEEKNDEKLMYIYLECFDEKKDINEIREFIFKDIENKWDKVYIKLYKLLKLNVTR